MHILCDRCRSLPQQRLHAGNEMGTSAESVRAESEPEKGQTISHHSASPGVRSAESEPEEQR